MMMVEGKTGHARRAPTGRLRIAVTGPGGEPVTRFRVTLLEARTGKVVPRFLLATPDATGTLDAVPVGSYRLRVDPLGRAPEAMLLPAVGADCAIDAERETRVVLRCGLGGRLRLELRTPGRRGPARLARVRCRAADALEAVLLRFFFPADAHVAAWAIGVDVPLDRPSLSHTLLAPGPHELDAQIDGFRRVRRLVHVAAGAVAHVGVALERC